MNTRERPATTLANLTTLRVGGPISQLLEPTTEEQLTAAVADADRAGLPVLVLGGGSNLLASDEPFTGVVVRDRRQEITAVEGTDGHILLTATAGTPWDALVAWSVERSLTGLETLSGIPGSVGAAPVQNIGAYGREVSDTLVEVRAWDRLHGEVVNLGAAELELGYRWSVIKASVGNPQAAQAGGRLWAPTGRWVILAVSFALGAGGMSLPIRYAELARALGVEVGETCPVADVREAVLALRRSKGMVLDEGDHDTWSAGSFFTNPILSEADAARLLPEDAPRFPAGGGMVKTSAAWLIDHAGFSKGWSLPDARRVRASLSTKHVLALTNRGGASAQDIVDLARAVCDGVEARYGVRLVPEPVSLGITW